VLGQRLVGVELELVQKPPVLPEQIAVKAADGHQSLAEGARADFLFISAMHQVIRELSFGNVLQGLAGVIAGKMPDLPEILMLRPPGLRTLRVPLTRNPSSTPPGGSVAPWWRPSGLWTRRMR